jgi:hypothetical protein
MDFGTFIFLCVIAAVVVKALQALYDHHLFRTNPEAWAKKRLVELARQRAEEETKALRSEQFRRNVGLGASIARWFLSK